MVLHDALAWGRIARNAVIALTPRVIWVSVCPVVCCAALSGPEISGGARARSRCGQGNGGHMEWSAAFVNHGLRWRRSRVAVMRLLHTG